MKDLLLLIAGGVIVWVLMRGGSLLTISPGSTTAPMSVPLASGLEKFTNALSAAGPEPQPPTLRDVQGAQPQAPTIVVRAYSAPVVAPTPDQALGKAGGYFVINGYRLYCDLITPDLQYTGDEIMREWWNSLSDDTKRIQKSFC